MIVKNFDFKGYCTSLDSFFKACHEDGYPIKDIRETDQFLSITYVKKEDVKNQYKFSTKFENYRFDFFVTTVNKFVNIAPSLLDAKNADNPFFAMIKEMPYETLSEFMKLYTKKLDCTIEADMFLEDGSHTKRWFKDGQEFEIACFNKIVAELETNSYAIDRLFGNYENGKACDILD